MSPGDRSALAQRFLDLERTARAAGVSEERARIITMLATMWWNPEVWAAWEVDAINRAMGFLIECVSDPTQGTNPFPVNRALMLVDEGGPWQQPTFMREEDV